MNAAEVMPNPVDAQNFLRMLEPDGEFYFRAIKPKIKPATGKSRNVTFDELLSLNLAGWGAFVVVNGGGQTGAKINKARAAYVDFDKLDDHLERLKLVPFEPSFIVESSPGKHHPYWVIDGMPVGEFTRVQMKLIALLGSDPSVKDLPRVMRLPGFMHTKDPDNLFVTRVIHESGKRYSWAEFSEMLEAIEVTAPAQPAPSAPIKRAVKPVAKGPCKLLNRYASNVASEGEGGRNNALHSNAIAAFAAIKEGKSTATESDAVAALTSAGIGAGLDAGEVQATIASALNSGVVAFAQPAVQPARTVRTTEPSRDAQRIARGIELLLCKRIGIAISDKDTIEGLGVDPVAIDAVLTSVFWSSVQGKFIFLHPVDGAMLQFTSGEAATHMDRAFTAPFDAEEIERQTMGRIDARAGDAAAKKLVREILAQARAPILNHVKFENQRNSTEWRVDMFATHNRVELIENKARMILTHKKFAALVATCDPRVIADYISHFPRFNDFLDLIAAARFAGDRKKAYLWLNAVSDWGKGLLLGALKQVGIVTELSVKEVEGIFEGKPVGRSPLDFNRAWVLAIDEFKTVKSELKQLQSEIELAPKHQLVSSVEVFTKLFLSAEHVSSLAGENGVEDQFANRMSVFKESGTIEARPLFTEVGKDAYRNSIAAYISDYLNAKVDHYRSMGVDGATKAGDEAVTAFHSRYGLDTMFERFSDTLPTFAQTFAAWAKQSAGTVLSGGFHYLKTPSKVLDEYIGNTLDFSQAGAMRHKKHELLRLMCADGRGCVQQRVSGESMKAVKLRNYGTGDYKAASLGE